MKSKERSKDIFEIANIQDIPEELKKALFKEKSLSGLGKMEALFNKKEELTIDEILVGLYREFKEIRNRGWVLVQLHRLKKLNFLVVLKFLGSGPKVYKKSKQVNKKVLGHDE